MPFYGPLLLTALVRSPEIRTMMCDGKQDDEVRFDEKVKESVDSVVEVSRCAGSEG